METLCNICGNNTIIIFDAAILKKYQVHYYQCKNCSFIQTDKPYWLSEAYASAITALDVGLIYRNIFFSKLLPSILDSMSNIHSSYIDYGGGYGILVRIMRDLGYNFFLHDLYAENLFAKHFEYKDYESKEKFACLTAFEVFEHLESPIKELEKMFELSDTLIFSTELQPNSVFTNSKDWSYFLPEIGQHISFYSKNSLIALSKRFQCHLYSNDTNLHILTKRKIKKDPFCIAVTSNNPFLLRIFNRFLNLKSQRTEIKNGIRTSFLMKDFELYKNILNDL